jgi:penicillin-binding protein 1A
MPKKRSRRRNSKIKLIGKFAVITSALIGVLLGFFVVFMLFTTNNVPELPPPKQATIFFDVNKKELAKIFVENRRDIPYQEIPDYMKKAIIDVEDVRYFEHSGVDLKSIMRAVWVDFTHGESKQGGSTITQQLAKNVLLTQEKKLTRKVRELFLAINLERNYTKEEILERYLNQIYLGHGTYGIDAASRLYFGKSVTKLQLHQIALLAGLPKSPNGYSPYENPERALERRNVVLSQMAKYGSITQKEADLYSAKPLDVIPLTASRKKAAYYVSYVIQKLKKYVNETSLYTGGYQIYTTIDLLAQEAAEEAVASLKGGKPDKLGVLQPQSALIAIDPRNGYIKAMVGGRDFNNTQLNRSIMAYRQPGSTIKPFVYTAAIDSRKYTPNSIVVDEEIRFSSAKGEYVPQNYDRIFRGPITLRQALENSVNTIAIKLVDDLGMSTVVDYARKMGLKSLVVNGPVNDLNLASLALGGLTKGVTPLEITTAFSPLANQGIKVEPISILAVKDPDGNLLYEERPRKSVAIPAATAYLVTDMLRGVILRGTGKSAILDRPAAGKTGTTSDNTNAWFIGYTPDLLASVWIGNDAQKIPIRLNGISIGSGRAAAIWGMFMRKALSKTPPSDFIPPEGVVTNVEICAQTGQLATAACPDIRYEAFLAGTEPVERCQLHQDGSEPSIFDYDNNDSTGLPIQNPAANPDEPPSYKTPSGPVLSPAPLQAAPQKKRKVMVRICNESGMLATANCPESQVSTEIFTEGEEPTEYCTIHKKR